MFRIRKPLRRLIRGLQWRAPCQTCQPASSPPAFSSPRGGGSGGSGGRGAPVSVGAQPLQRASRIPAMGGDSYQHRGAAALRSPCPNPGASAQWRFLSFQSSLNTCCVLSVFLFCRGKDGKATPPGSLAAVPLPCSVVSGQVASHPSEPPFFLHKIRSSGPHRSM